MAGKNYTVLARKWRPQLFEEVVGQEHITRTLKNAIASGRIHHAFLFLGSRGIGKTTTARVLAKALNCLKFDAPTVTPCGECDNCVSIAEGNNIDVIEIDGASNNGVDNVREIRDNIRMVPSSGRYKVYIIDEVHQLSAGAFNALLKTLEEPPSHAVFILATTEAHKIPATIISRCQRYDFRRVSIGDIVTLLRNILNKEGMKATDEALYAIARAAEGGVRDAESIMDELITYCDGEITFQDVFDVLGLVDWRVLHTLCDALSAGDIARLLTLVEEVVSAGKDLSQFVEEILRYYRNLLVCKTSGSADLLRLPPDEIAEMRARADRFGLVKLIGIVEQFATLTNGFDSQLAQRTALEALLIRLSKVDVEVSLDTIMEKLVLLGQGGVCPSGAAAPPKKEPGPNPPEAGPAHAAPPVPAVSPARTAREESVPPARPAAPPAAAITPPPVPAKPAEPVLSLEMRQRALVEEHPGLAAVLGVFRGKVVAVKSGAGVEESEVEGEIAPPLGLDADFGDDTADPD
ncbi:MAG: DNA polymerase III subunit gamma/tau [Candidatus Hydrogenedentes bacterium]|nr:DNA polymerase III subunit gamma/tau [Candidatus Hydrogenedentota bacterium]